MSALVERIIASRDILKALNIANYAIIADVRDVLADAANAVTERDAVIAQLLSHSVSHYGKVEDASHGVGQVQARAQAVLEGRRP